MKLSNTAFGLAASKLSGNPFYIRYQVTYRCNYACRMCGQRALDADPARELSLAQIETAASRLAHLHARHIVLTGGEPFMRKDLASIISIFHKHKFSVRLQTNGGPQVSHRRLSECVAAGLNDISVSIDTLDRSVQDEICRRNGVVEHALRTLELARQLIPSGICQANIVASRFNFEELPSLVRYFHERGIYTYITPVMVILDLQSEGNAYQFRSQDHSFEIEDLSTQIHARVIGELIQLHESGFGLTNSTRFLRDYQRDLDAHDHSWRCNAGTISLDILPDGSVTACKEKEPFGSILQPGFEGYFRSREYRDYAAGVASTCAGCFYGEYREPQYVLQDRSVFLEWISRWFRTYRFGMRFNKKLPLASAEELRQTAEE